ncbi:MAG: trypsin-like peptidase domain-containing protein [Vicinamibacterales bacterium]
MSTRKTTHFYALLIAVSSLAVGMVIASRLDLTSTSSAQTFEVPSANSAPVTGALDAQTFRNIASSQSPMVVNIRTETTRRAQNLSEFFGGGGQDELFRRFFGDPPAGREPPREQTTVAAGTGFIISADGLILTNNHVVEQATRIQVAFYGEDQDQYYDARVIGRDALTDSALIQLTEKPSRQLPVAKFGDSSQMAAGDWVMAIGNPFGFRHTVSVGVISATERPFPVTDGRSAEMLQTDAAINPGNSGGPLLNLRGEVVGMNTAIISNGQVEGNIGIGFAIPINTIRELLPQLHTGRVVRGRIGVSITAVPIDGYQDFGLESREGAVVSMVSPGGSADRGGIRAGDVIVSFNGRPVPDTNELVKMVTATRPGTSVPVRIIREGREQTVNVVVDELDLESERGAQSRTTPDPTLEQQGSDSFGLVLTNLTPDQARQLELPAGRTGALVTEVDPNGPSAGAIRQGDVILMVNRQAVSTASEAGAALQQIGDGRLAQILLWRGQNEVFVTVRRD